MPPDFSKEQSKKVQVGSKEGIITILKPSSLKTHCSETQVDPVLGLSGSWQIGKKDGQAERANSSTQKLAIISTRWRT
jgi:hypothetical protein